MAAPTTAIVPRTNRQFLGFFVGTGTVLMNNARGATCGSCPTMLDVRAGLGGSLVGAVIQEPAFGTSMPTSSAMTTPRLTAHASARNTALSAASARRLMALMASATES